MIPYRTLPPTTIRGFNLGPDVSALQDATEDAWLATYRDWETSWPFLEMQIDLAAAFGCNAIRLIGDVAGPIVGAFTRADYLARVGQVIAACQARGLYYYATAGGPPYLPVSNAACFAEIQAFAAFVSRYPNVMAIDACQEVDGCRYNQCILPGYAIGSLSWGQIQTLVSGSIAAARAGAPNLPITCSVTSATGVDGNIPSAVWAYCDYIDIHDYDPDGNTVAVASAASAYPGVPILIGEHGANLHGSTASARTAAITAQRTVLSYAGVRGGLLWATINALPADTTYYGAWSYDGTTPQTDVLTPYATYPIGTYWAPDNHKRRRA